MKDTFALVTGASSGIGYQYARQLASYGYRLIIISNEKEALEHKAVLLREEFKVEAIPLVVNLGAQSAAKDVYLHCSGSGYVVEVLVNNAGVYHDRDFLKDSEEFNSLILNLHVYTPAMLEYYFGKDMVARGKGYILNMSSITSDMAIQRLATYSSTKAFLKNLSRSTHIELKRYGVNVICVRPGAVATGLYNLSPRALKAGLVIGYITTPEKLARRAVKAMFRGKSRITPGLSSKILLTFVRLLPATVMKLIRKLEIF